VCIINATSNPVSIHSAHAYLKPILILIFILIFTGIVAAASMTHSVSGTSCGGAAPLPSGPFTMRFVATGCRGSRPPRLRVAAQTPSLRIHTMTRMAVIAIVILIVSTDMPLNDTNIIT